MVTLNLVGRRGWRFHSGVTAIRRVYADVLGTLPTFDAWRLYMSLFER